MPISPGTPVPTQGAATVPRPSSMPSEGITVVTTRPETAHPPSQMSLSLTDLPELAHSASWADRLSLRVGLWLLLRSARNVVDPLRAAEDHERVRLQMAARAQHEENITRARLMVTQFTILR